MNLQALNTPKRVSENAPGDFYVEDGCCLASRIVHDIVPDLMDDMHEEQTEYLSCFFKRQPQTLEEIDQAIKAMCTSCSRALRYGGDDPEIIAKLRTHHEAELCDQSPEYRKALKKQEATKNKKSNPSSLWSLISWVLRKK